MWFGRSQRKMLARSAPKQPRGRLGHLDQQRLDLAGLVPLLGDFQDRLQAAESPVVMVRQVTAARPSFRNGAERGQTCLAWPARSRGA